jgi:predicted Ser/Thr protein kinase
VNPPTAVGPIPTIRTVLLDRYELIEEIGRGGYSVVYAARDRTLGTEVAVKLLVPPPASADVARERMRREVKAVRGLAHPNVVALYDFHEDGPWSFIIMERIQGLNLARRVAGDGPVEIDDVIRIGLGVASALAAAHAKGILHRDVKPQNILLEHDGTPRLVDFGSARLDGHTVTRTGGLVGTIQYTAPELLLGTRADPRADLYSLGVTLYFALTGRLPAGSSAHSAPSPNATGFRPRRVRADVPEWLDDVIATATCAEPESRLPTAASMVAALRGEDALVVGTPLPSRRCLICDEPEPFGLGICPSCGGAAHAVGDTLVFVKAPTSRADHVRVGEALGPLLQGRGYGAEQDLVASGHRALIEIPAALVDSVAEILAVRGIPVRATPTARTWTSAPLPFYALLLSMVLVGGAAGMAAAPLLLWASPLMAVLLLLVAQRRLQRPIIEPGRRRAVFPSEIEERIAKTFVEHRQRSARRLLAALVRAAEPTYRTLQGTRYPPVPTEQVDALLLHACRAASDLSDLDESLEHLESRWSAETAQPDGRWMDGLVRAERVRDGLIQKLLDGIAVMHRLRAATIQASPARELLGDLVDAIDESTRAHAEALREIEALLEGDPRA